MGRAQAWQVALAVCGGWLVLLPASTLTLALRLKDWQVETGGSGYTEYSVIELIAWLVLIAALVVAGRVADRMARRAGGTARLLSFALLGVLVLSVGLAVAPSVVTIAIAWVLIQIPAAVVISTSLGWGGQHVAESRRSLMSGLVGAAPIVALVIGSLAVRATGSAPLVFVIVGVLTGALVLPLTLVSRRVQAVEMSADDTSSPRLSSYLRTFTVVWVAVLLSDLLLSNATAITNTYVVAFVDSVPAFAGDVTRIASQTLLLASLFALIASVVSGVASKGLRRSASAFAVGCVLVLVGIAVVLLWAGPMGLTLGAALFGAGFGAANGAEMALVLSARSQSGTLGSDLGVLNAVTSVPYVLIPLVALGVMSESTHDGVRRLYWLAVVVVGVGALVAAWVATRGARRAKDMVDMSHGIG